MKILLEPKLNKHTIYIVLGIVLIVALSFAYLGTIKDEVKFEMLNKIKFEARDYKEKV